MTRELVLAMERAGADLIELGIPFSDPTAEGPVIQAANIRALAGGVTTDKIFDMVQELRKQTEIPLAFMTYANVVFSYGIEKFVKRAVEIGMDALILPDIPLRKRKSSPASAGIRPGIYLADRATSRDRIKMIAAEAEGFVYCVSSMGVTGERVEITSNVKSMVELVKKEKEIPCAIGFGISTPQQAGEMAACADGVIVGSAIVRLCGEHGKDCVPVVEDYVKKMKEAIQ